MIFYIKNSIENKLKNQRILNKFVNKGPVAGQTTNKTQTFIPPQNKAFTPHQFYREILKLISLENGEMR